MFFQAQKDIIGIDIGSSSVKLVQLREVKGGCVESLEQYVI